MKQENNLKWVTAVQTMGTYKLFLTFNDGCQKLFDCEPLMEQYPIFQPLRDMDVFRNISLDGWTVTWLDGAVDIAPEFLYENGISA